jgi:hypothetical protein
MIIVGLSKDYRRTIEGLSKDYRRTIEGPLAKLSIINSLSIVCLTRISAIAAESVSCVKKAGSSLSSVEWGAGSGAEFR